MLFFELAVLLLLSNDDGLKAADVNVDGNDVLCRLPLPLVVATSNDLVEIRSTKLPLDRKVGEVEQEVVVGGL